MPSDDWISDIIFYPTLGLCICSLIGNGYVLRSTWKLKATLRLHYGRSAHITHDYIIYHLIYMLAILDSFNIICLILTNRIHWDEKSTLCIAFGFCGQFASIISSLWRLLVPLYLLYLLATDNKHQKKTSNAYVSNPKIAARNELIFISITLVFIILSFLGSIIPLIWDNKNHYGVLYNYTKNGISYGAECWVTGEFILITYSVRLLGVLMDVIALVFAIYKYTQTKWYTNAYLVLIKRLSAWVLVFMIIRIAQFVERLIYVIIGGFTVPLWFVLLQHYLLVSTGIANAIVWNHNRRVKSSNINESNPNRILSKQSDNNNNNNTNNNVNINTTKKNSSGKKRTALIENEMTLTDDSNIRTEQPSQWESFDTQVVQSIN